MVHEACAAFIVALATVMDPAPAAAAVVAPAGHVETALGIAATTTPAGRLSVKPMPDCAGLPAPLASVKVRVDVPPKSIASGAKAFVSAAWTTVNVAEAAVPVTATGPVADGAEVWFAAAPGVVLVTFTST